MFRSSAVRLPGSCGDPFVDLEKPMRDPIGPLKVSLGSPGGSLGVRLDPPGVPYASHRGAFGVLEDPSGTL